MREILKKNFIFIISLFVLLIVLIPVFILGNKEDIHIYLNKFHSSFTDVFFKFITILGSGIAPVIAGIILLLFSIRKSILITTSGMLAGLIVQILKRFVFSDVPRPSKVFFDLSNLHYIEGVELHWTNSFPSGHSATIFALCFCLAFFANRNIYKLILLLVAVVVAYSRVYLSQHFLIDVYAGALIGVLSGILIAYVFNNIKAKWFDMSLIYLLFRNNRK
jgi:membrane-associated phospholipid phosphatase